MGLEDNTVELDTQAGRREGTGSGDCEEAPVSVPDSPEYWSTERPLDQEPAPPSPSQPAARPP